MASMAMLNKQVVPDFVDKPNPEGEEENRPETCWFPLCDWPGFDRFFMGGIRPLSELIACHGKSEVSKSE